MIEFRTVFFGLFGSAFGEISDGLFRDLASLVAISIFLATVQTWGAIFQMLG